MTDRAGLRLLKLAKAEIMNVNNFVFFFSSAIDGLSNKVFTEWIKFLLNCLNELAVPIALKLYYFYYVHGKQEPALSRDLMFQLLAHPLLFEKSDLYQFDTMTTHYWTEIGKVFLVLDEEKSLVLAEKMLEHFGTKGTIFGEFKKKALSLLTEMTKLYPEQVWERVGKYLKPRENLTRTFILEKWLKREDLSDPTFTEEENGAITLIPRKKIWEWIEEDIENRVGYFALRFVPITLAAAIWQISLAREVLVRYGERKNVRTNLLTNYSFSEPWSGELSLNLDAKKRALLRIGEGEDNENVKQ